METQEEREQRKEEFVAYAMDKLKITQEEAEEMFERANKQ